MAAGRPLFLQMRAHRAGAQTSLHRVLSCAPVRARQPVLVCGEEGWLTEAVRGLGHEVLVEAFPSSRSVGARLVGNRRFAARVAARAPDLSTVIANDHPEALLAAALAARRRVPWQVVLRTAAMTARDADKYQVAGAAGVWAVGARLRTAAEGWGLSGVAAYPEGLLEAEWGPVRAPPPAFPTRVLLGGHGGADKGWGDLWAALDRLPADFPAVRWTATGEAPTPAPRLPAGHTVDFVGRVDGLGPLLEAHDLLIHPSRAETYGLFPLEAWAAGVVTLASRTGRLAELDLPARFVFTPEDPAALAAALVELWRSWATVGEEARRMQATLRRGCTLESGVGAFADAL